MGLKLLHTLSIAYICQVDLLRWVLFVQDSQLHKVLLSKYITDRLHSQISDLNSECMNF